MGNIGNTKSADALSFNTFNSSALKKSGALILFCLLSGCALFPPPPAQCSGQFKPINVPVEKVDASNKPTVDSNAGNKSGELDKPLQSEEGAVDGK